MTEPDVKTILVVEDNHDLSTLVATVLSEDGYRVETASNGEEALASVQRAMPDLILLDVKMPVMDGPEFAREFRARFERDIPIIILTASGDARTRAEEMGATDWIGKPFDLAALTSTVTRHMRKR
jgi:CheY-like chemotaxis protein